MFPTLQMVADSTTLTARSLRRPAQKHGEKHSKRGRRRKASYERDRSRQSPDAAHKRRRDRSSRSPGRADAPEQGSGWSDKRQKRELWDSPDNGRKAGLSLYLLRTRTMPLKGSGI